MNNKFIQKLLYAISVVLLCTTEYAYAVEQSPASKDAMKTMVTKFSLAMAGVVVFSILISVGLSLYNKFFVSSQIKDYNLSKDSLRTPRDTEEAILMFITKNRLK